MESKKSIPVEWVQSGSLRGTIFKNYRKNGKIFYTFTIEKVYKDENGEWKKSHFYSEYEIGQLTILTNKIMITLHKYEVDEKQKRFLNEMD